MVKRFTMKNKIQQQATQWRHHVPHHVKQYSQYSVQRALKLICMSMFAAWLPVLGAQAQAVEGLVVNVSTGTSAGSSAGAVKANEKRMDFAFQDIPVRALLQLLGETAGMNVVTDESVGGTITLNLKQASWQEALDVIVRAKNLRTEQLGGAIYVRGNELVSNAYAGVDAVNDQMPRQRYSQEQVLIEARIVEAEDSFSRTLGVKLGFNDMSRTQYRRGYERVLDPNGSGEYIDLPIQIPVRSPSSGAIFGGNTASVTQLSGQTSGTVGLGVAPTGGNSMINFPALVSAGGVDPASFAVSLFNSSMSRFINLEISALETDGKGKMISNPRVVTSNNVKAIIEQGTEIPYQQATSSGATSVSFRKANLKLEVTPQIASNGEVMLDVDVTKDSVGARTNEGYAINTKHVKTQVTIDNGGTLVIGGIYQEDNRKAVDKVPLLGDIPLLGNLFKTTTRSINKNELLIFLTPHLLDARGNILPAKSGTVTIDE